MFHFNFLLLLVFGALISLTAAATSAPIFCKCACFKNSTLIQLGPQSSCAQCTHAYCLSQDLPICKSSSKEISDTDVQSTCIQRDSRKDQIIVWGFILGTAGLLGWAGAKRVNELRESRRNKMRAAGTSDGDRRPYIPVPGTRD